MLKNYAEREFVVEGNRIAHIGPIQEEDPLNWTIDIGEAMSGLDRQLQTKPDDEERTEGPSGLQVTLFDHQERALAWMLWRESCEPAGGVLADDTSLGQTITTIALILKSLEDEFLQNLGDSRKNAGGTLIVCSDNSVTQWAEDLLTKGNFSAVTIYDQGDNRDISVLGQYQVVITSYEALLSSYTRHKILFKIHWRRVVLDEVHVVKSSDTLKLQCVAALIADKRWALTGMPIGDNVKDIFPIVRFLHLRPFDDSRIFDKWIVNDDAAGTARLHRVLECIMLRRTRDGLIDAGLMPELLRKTNRVIDVLLEPEERFVYDRVMNYSKSLFIQFVRQMKEGERLMALEPDYRKNDDIYSVQLTPVEKMFWETRGPVALHDILSLIMRLRQICCHPALIMNMLVKEDFETAGIVVPEGDVLRQADQELLDDLAEFERRRSHGIEWNGRLPHRSLLTRNDPVFDESTVSSKMVGILVLVQDIIEKGEKVVIVSEWPKFLDIIDRHLGEMPGARCRFYTASMTHDERACVVDCFNNTDEDLILLLSFGAGINQLVLKAANHVIIADAHWNPQMEIQAVNTVHRIGQTKKVFIHKFICQGTIEENIQALQERKSQIEGVRHGVVGLELDKIASLFNM